VCAYGVIKISGVMKDLDGVNCSDYIIFGITFRN
jgi:hypothetical protein